MIHVARPSSLSLAPSKYIFCKASLVFCKHVFLDLLFLRILSTWCCVSCFAFLLLSNLVDAFAAFCSLLRTLWASNLLRSCLKTSSSYLCDHRHYCLTQAWMMRQVSPSDQKTQVIIVGNHNHMRHVRPHVHTKKQTGKC